MGPLQCGVGRNADPALTELRYDQEEHVISKLSTLCAAALVATACTTAPVVYAPGDTNADPPSGEVDALPKLLGTAGGPVRVVLIHGVGDHCQGFALGKDGWLGEAAMATIGLEPLPNTEQSQVIPVDVFMIGGPDPNSRVEWARRRYRLTGSMLPKVEMDAIEITWSPLTRWIKTIQLSYDSPSVFAQTADLPPCVEAPSALGVPQIKDPPSRLVLDRIIKEQVFDRNLADAMIYAGTYSPTIERGVAEALCHAVTGQASTLRCTWPDPAADPYTYLFVTHSLGSRILYDTLIHLLGYHPFAKPNPFDKGPFEPNGDYLAAAEPFVGAMLAHTPAIYMMANQISLMGITDVPPSARSTAGPQPFSVPRLQATGPRATDVDACANVVSALATARDVELARRRLTAPGLHLVAFNDTNDLLTWHIPKWYANDRYDPCRPDVRLANVFVRNTAPLVVLEMPLQAHVDYFTRRDVWRVIACGAKGDRVGNCL